MGYRPTSQPTARRYCFHGGAAQAGRPAFSLDTGDGHRIIPGDIAASDLVMTHISANYDRSGFQRDWNVVFPLDRLREMADEGVIGSVANYHFSFMGAHDPTALEAQARSIAAIMKKDGVNTVLLVPV